MLDAVDADVAWGRALARIVDASHLVTGGGLSDVLEAALEPLGLGAQVLVADLAQRVLTPVQPELATPLPIERTLAGRAYQHGEITAGHADTDRDDRVLWVPMLDGTERVGVLCLQLDAPARGDGGPTRPASVADDETLRRWSWSLAGLMGHILVTKLAMSDRLRRLRSNGPLAPSAELLWSLLPPRTCATTQVVITALLEPHDLVGGDAYDYAVDGTVANLAVFDGVGHDIRAGLTTTLAVTATRNARRDGETDLATLARRADDLIGPRPNEFVTAVLARLDTSTGALSYLLAGHPPPLLVREGKVIKRLEAVPRPPLGVASVPSPRPDGLPSPGVAGLGTGREQLEPGDRLLLYTDGIVEARSPDGAFFGEERLVDFTERAALDRLSAPETLRRLAAAVLAYQGGRLQDDATLLMVDWSPDAYHSMAPSFLA